MDFVDEITITGIRAYGFHGVYPDEKRDGQEFIVDAQLFVSTARAAETDDVADTVHYGELAEAIAGDRVGRPGRPHRDAREPHRRCRARP